MTRIEYLKKCIQLNKPITFKHWYTLCFGIPLLKNETDWTSRDPFSIVLQLDGLHYIQEVQTETGVEKKLVKITDHQKDKPLFQFKEVIQVDASWLPTIKSSIETKIGNLIINALVLYPTLGTKVDYINKPIKVGDIESIFVNRVRNDEDLKESDISVKEMSACIDRLNFLSNLAFITSVASTVKTITPPPNMKKERTQLLKEYEGQLNDPVKVVELESKLTAIDNAYLADDEAAKTILSNKARTARKKFYGIFGETKDFVKTGDTNVILQNLSEGVSTTPEDFPKYLNDARTGSFFRGASTAKGGYTYKILQRSLSSLKIQAIACNTTKGFKRLITENNYKKLVNRYIRAKGWVLITSDIEAKKYIGQIVELRSTMYCTATGNTVCYACMSENYKDSETGVTNLAANISNVLLTAFLQATHGGIVETTTIEMNDLVT
jgi:hypothetical protein